MSLGNFGVVDQFVYRSAQPDERGFADLAALGCKSVIKLNTPLVNDPEPNWCTKYGLKIDMYPIQTLHNSTQAIMTIANAVKNLTAGGIVLVHCTHGRDRTGLVIGAYRIMFNNWNVDQVNAERADFGVVGLVKLADMDMDVILREIYSLVHK